MLLKANCRLDVTNLEGETALHIAIRRGVLQAIFALLRFGACLKASDKHGNTALHLVALYDVQPAIKQLVEAVRALSTITLGFAIT